MNNILKEIDSSKHVMIVADASSVAGASALYTHILRLHKKVSLVCQTNLENKFAFLPWFDNIKTHKVASADFVIEFNNSAIELYDFFKKSAIKINPKMATALYAGHLVETDGFLNSTVNGTTFAVVNELIECGADYKVCNYFIKKRTALSSLRLKAIMFTNMTLINDAKAALFCIDENDIKSSGASLLDCDEILKEALKIPSVELCVLLDKDKEYEVINLIYKEI